jgi:hypothetical protein
MKNAVQIIIVILASGFTLHVHARQAAARSNSEPVIEITFEHKGCCGPCPVEKITFKLDGNHTYVGVANVGRLGTYRPKSGDQAFEVLVRVLERLDFFSLRSDYARSIGPQETIITVKKGNETKSVRVNEAQGESPIEMTIIIAYIEKVMSKIVWEKMSDARPLA